jgi:hypothetical protein
VIVAQCFASGDANNANCQAIHRSTLTGALSGGSGIGVDTLYANVAVMRTRGIDLGLNFHRGPRSGFHYGFDIAGTYVINNYRCSTATC